MRRQQHEDIQNHASVPVGRAICCDRRRKQSRRSDEADNTRPRLDIRELLSTGGDSVNGLQSNVGLLLLILAICLAYPYCREFVDWFKRRYRIMKRCQYRREAAKTNRMLYKCTKNDYYKERMEALGRRKEKCR